MPYNGGRLVAKGEMNACRGSLASSIREDGMLAESILVLGQGT